MTTPKQWNELRAAIKAALSAAGVVDKDAAAAHKKVASSELTMWRLFSKLEHTSDRPDPAETVDLSDSRRYEELREIIDGGDQDATHEQAVAWAKEHAAADWRPAPEFSAVWRELQDVPEKTGRYCVGHAGGGYADAYYTARQGDTSMPVGWGQMPTFQPTHWLDGPRPPPLLVDHQRPQMMVPFNVAARYVKVVAAYKAAHRKFLWFYLSWKGEREALAYQMKNLEEQLREGGLAQPIPTMILKKND